MSNYSSIKFHAHISSTVGNIRDWLLLNCAFIISNVTQSTVLQFLQNFSKNNIFGFSVVFSRKIVQISIKVEYLENGLADFNDFGLILQDFERLFRCNQLVLALQFSFKHCLLPIGQSWANFVYKIVPRSVIFTRKSHNFAGTAFVQGDSVGGSKLTEQTPRTSPPHISSPA